MAIFGKFVQESQKIGIPDRKMIRNTAKASIEIGRGIKGKGKKSFYGRYNMINVRGKYLQLRS